MQAQNQVTPFFAGAFVAYLLLIPSNELVQEKTLYFDYCNDFKHNSLSCPEKTKLFKQEYKIFVNQQIVVVGPPYLITYKNCTVFDKNNWSCQEGKQITAFLDSSLQENPRPESIDKDGSKSSLPLRMGISAFEYYIRSFADFFR